MLLLKLPTTKVVYILLRYFFSLLILLSRPLKSCSIYPHSEIDMGKKKKKGNKGIVSFTNQGNRSVAMPFRIYQSQNVATTTLTITEVSLQIANFGARIVDAGDIFTQFRLRSLNVRSFTMPATTTTVVPNGCVHGIAITGTAPLDYVTPSSLSTLVDFPEFNVGSAFDQVNLSANIKELYGMTPTKWFNCSNSSDTFSAGTVTYFLQPQGSTMSFTQHCVVSGMIEFIGPIDPALIPLEKLEIRLERERLLLEKRIEDLKAKKLLESVQDFDEKKFVK